MPSPVTMICSTWATDTLNTCFPWPASSEASYSTSSSLTHESSVFSSLRSIPQISSSSSVAAPELSTSSSVFEAVSDIYQHPASGAKTLLVIVKIIETVVVVGDIGAGKGRSGQWEYEDLEGGEHRNDGDGQNGVGCDGGDEEGGEKGEEALELRRRSSPRYSR